MVGEKVICAVRETIIKMERIQVSEEEGNDHLDDGQGRPEKVVFEQRLEGASRETG